MEKWVYEMWINNDRQKYRARENREEIEGGNEWDREGKIVKKSEKESEGRAARPRRT